MVPRVEGARYRSFLRFLYEGVEGLVFLVLVLLSWPISRRWLANWGSTSSEQSAGWPDDRFVTGPEVINTRAVTVGAPPRSVWPWIAQFGLGKAGFYSYELLERIVGIPVRNIESVLPQFQQLEVGDEVLLHPSAPGIPVAEVEPGRFVCFCVSPGLEDRFERPEPNRSWSMYLTPAGAGSTRLVLRSCIEPLRRATFAGRLRRLMEEAIDFAMEQRMLRSIRRLSESGVGQASETVAPNGGLLLQSKRGR
jgi:hypothetical protein